MATKSKDPVVRSVRSGSSKAKKIEKTIGTKPPKTKTPTEAPKVQVGWDVTDEFKQQAVTLLQVRPFNEVNNIIQKLMGMTRVNDDEINEVINFLGSMPWMDVHTLMQNLVPELIKPAFEE